MNFADHRSKMARILAKFIYDKVENITARKKYFRNRSIGHGWLVNPLPDDKF